jgi:hypothetical protein
METNKLSRLLLGDGFRVLRGARRTRWRGSGCENVTEGEWMSEGALRAGQCYFGEQSQPRGGGIGCAKAGTTSSKGRGTPREAWARVGLNRPNVVRVRQTREAELRRARIHYGKAKSVQSEHEERFLTSGRHSGRLDMASGAPSGRHDGRASLASSGGGARERLRAGEMRQGREGGCARARARPSGRNGQEREGAGLLSVFYSELLIPFLFIFSFEFKSTQTTNSNLNISNMGMNQKQKQSLSSI